MRRRSHADRLRVAIECLPRHTREAMLDGVRANPIIAGAYTSGDGVCPMLAAHRRGGRTDFIGFAQAWDRFTGVRTGRSRRADRRELATLVRFLEHSLREPEAVDLAAAVAEHRELKRHAEALSLREVIAEHRTLQRHRALREEHDLGDETPPRRRRPDRYERALARLEAEHARIVRAGERTPQPA